MADIPDEDGTLVGRPTDNPFTQVDAITPGISKESAPLLSSSSRQTPGFLPVRYQLGLLMFFAMTVMHAMRQNVSVAMEAMVTVSYTSADRAKLGMLNGTGIDTCSTHDTNTSTEYSEESEGEFDWSTETQELIIAAIFYGYICTQIPGGWLSDRFGGKWVMGAGLLTSIGCTLVGPTAARGSSAAYFATRVIAGLGEGVTFPAMLSAWAKWAHPTERSLLAASGYAGINVGYLLGDFVSGELCTLELDGGWPLGFYLFGILGVIWFILWCICVRNTPEEHPWISGKELEYLQGGLEISKKSNVPVPWRAILTSFDVWILIITQFVTSWGVYVFYTNLPLYLGSGLGLSISQTGIYLALPYCLTLIVLVVSAYVSDELVSRRILTAQTTRRLMNSIAFGSFAVFIAAAGLAGCNVSAAVTCVVLAIGISGCVYSGYYVSILDVCGTFAGSVMGIMSMIGTTVGIFGPYIVGILTELQTDIRGWQNVLWLLSGIYFAGAVVFAVFGSSRLQPWAVVSGDNRSISNGEYQELK